MAETKGITIDFYGNTVEFDRSVDGLNRALRAVKNELLNVNKQMKLDPSSVELAEKKFAKLKEQQKVLTEQVKLYQDALSKLGQEDVGSEEWKKLTQDLNKAQTALNKVNHELDRIPLNNVRQLGEALEKAGNKLNSIGSSIESVGRRLTVLSTASAGLIATGIKYNATLEQQTALFTTLTGSVEKAERVLNSIKEDATKSPFDVSSLISANQYLIATGLEADESRKVIMDLGDAISATGGGNSELQRMAQNLQQIQNVGKASSIDMKQFAMAGIDIWGILADSTGKTVSELQKMDITFDMIASALSKASSEGGKYYGAMEKQSETLTGQINKLKASISQLLGELTETLIPIIQNVLDKIGEWVEKLRGLDDVSKNLITRIGLIVAGLSPMLTLIGKLIGSSGLGGLISKMGALVKSQKFGAWVLKIGGSVSDLSGLLSTLLKAFSSLITPINLIISALILAYSTSESFRNAVNELVSNIISSLKPAFESIVVVIKSVISAFIKILSAVGQLIGALATPLVNALSSVSSWMSKLLPIVSSLAKLFSSTLGVAVNAVVEVIKTAITWIQALYTKLANTTWGQNFKAIVSDISRWLDGLISVISNVVGWFQKLIDKANAWLGVDNAVKQSSSTTSTYNQGGKAHGGGSFGGGQITVLDSGGIGLTTHIHVNNNGSPIDEQEVSRWVDVMAGKINEALGRSL